MIEFTLTPVDEIPNDKRRKKIKIDEVEIQYYQKHFPNAYKADYVQDIYKRFGIGGFKTEKELTESYDESKGDDKENACKIHKKKTE